jgi:hypothetical protein
MTKRNINSTIYTETIQDLRAKMEDQNETVAKFCEAHNIDKFNTACFWLALRALMLSNERNKEEQEQQNKL